MALPTNIVVPFFTTKDDSLFTNCHEFQRWVCQLVKPTTKLVRISSYNVGISIDNNTIDSFVASMCAAKQVQLLVGHNPHHHKNFEISAVLKRWHDKHKNLEIRRAEKLHAKIVSVTSGALNITWTGSLNLITPTLFDVMAKLTPQQSKALMEWFDNIWKRSSVVFTR